MSEENQNIENFLRKGLGQKEFEFREEDWEKMAARLDAVMPPGPTGGMSTAAWIRLSVVLVGVSFFSGWMLSGFYREKQKPVVELSGGAPEVLVQPTERSTNDDTESLRAEEGTQPELPAESGTRPKDLAGNEPSNEVTFSQPIVQARSPKALAEGTMTVEENDRGYSGDDSPRGFRGGELANGAIAGGAPLGIVEQSRPDGQSGFSPLTPKQLAIQGTVSPAPVLVSFRPGEQPSVYEPARPVRQEYVWAAGASFSPDFSATSLAPNVKEIGKAYGLLIEWQPFSKWRFATGVYKADKVYTAAKGDYRPPLYNGWPDGVEPVSTDAACDVLDIPLTAGFRLIDGRKTSLWLSGGISSYWMLSESYRYHYDDYEGYRIKGWFGEKENSHPLSVVNLSVSVESRLTERLSLKFEPFFKLPLGGVGYGDVKLYTAGSLVSLRYHFSQRGASIAAKPTDHYKNH